MVRKSVMMETRFLETVARKHVLSKVGTLVLLVRVMALTDAGMAATTARERTARHVMTATLSTTMDVTTNAA
jgi:hypothetical protein